MLAELIEDAKRKIQTLISRKPEDDDPDAPSPWWELRSSPAHR
jgi:hypothetical protein